jgi:uncharacterized membrane protein
MTKGIDKFFDKWAPKLIGALIAAYVIIFTALCFYKYFSFKYYDWDFASDVITLWNSVHGKFLYYPFLEESVFGTHLYLVVFLIIPIYFLFQTPLILLFLQSLFFGLAACPLYLFSKMKVSKTVAFGIVLAYLLYPSVGFINLFETHPDIYQVFFLFFAIYFFEKENFRNFMIFVVLALCCKENVSFVVFMFGFYALLRKRSLKWVLASLILGAGWFLFAVKWIIPHFAKEAKLYQEGFMFSVYYSHLGSTMSEMAKTILTHPVAVARFALTPPKLAYIFQLFVPVAFFSLYSPGFLLMTIPIFMQNLLSLVGSHSKINFQYVATLIPFIFASVVFAFKNLLRPKTLFLKRHIILGVFLSFSIGSAFALKAPQVYLLKYFSAYKFTDLEKAKTQLIYQIPNNASVIATFQFLPRLADRYNLYSMHFVATGFKMYTNEKYEPPQNLDYALIDFNEPLMLGSFFPPQAADNIRGFLERGHWQVLKAAGDTVLFKKGNSTGLNLCEIVVNPKIENMLNANINDQILLLGYDVVNDEADGGKILHLIFYWKRTADFDTPVGFFIQFLDSTGVTKFTDVHTFGYRIYMPHNMPKDQVMREERYILIPSGVGNKAYNMRAGLFSLENGAILPPVEKEKTDTFGRLLLGDVLIP